MHLPDFVKKGDLYFGTVKQVSDDKYIVSLDIKASASIKKKNGFQKKNDNYVNLKMSVYPKHMLQVTRKMTSL